MNDAIARASLPSALAEATLRTALLDSRQRWRDLVTLGSDLAYETDAAGRFVFVLADPSLGWSTATLAGQPADLLLVGWTAANGFNPFDVTAPVRRKRAWLNRADGSAALLAFSAAPLLDDESRIVGVCGIGVDWSEYDEHQGPWPPRCDAARSWTISCGAWARRFWHRA
jgi:hypothetical protein